MVYRVCPVAYFGEPGASFARTQDEGALDLFVKDEDAASEPLERHSRGWEFLRNSILSEETGVIWPLKCQRTCEMGH